jgi:hypothetical protein
MRIPAIKACLSVSSFTPLGIWHYAGAESMNKQQQVQMDAGGWSQMHVELTHL